MERIGLLKLLSMKIAFCFLTYGDLSRPDFWNCYFNGYVFGRDYDIIVHPKEPGKVVSEYQKHIISSPIPTEWGDISLVRATLSMLRESYRRKNDFFVLVSDTTVPVTSFKILQQQLLIDNQNYLKTSRLKHGDINRYIHGIAKDFYTTINKNLIKHHQWFILNRETVSFLIDPSNDYTSKFEKMFAPDEHYFGIMLGLHDIPFTDRWTTFADWTRTTDKRVSSKRLRPAAFFELSKEYVMYIRHTFNPLFIRKILPETQIYPELEAEISS